MFEAAVAAVGLQIAGVWVEKYVGVELGFGFEEAVVFGGEGFLFKGVEAVDEEG